MRAWGPKTLGIPRLGPRNRAESLIFGPCQPMDSLSLLGVYILFLKRIIFLTKLVASLTS